MVAHIVSGPHLGGLGGIWESSPKGGKVSSEILVDLKQRHLYKISPTLRPKLSQTNFVYQIPPTNFHQQNFTNQILPIPEHSFNW